MTVRSPSRRASNCTGQCASRGGRTNSDGSAHGASAAQGMLPGVPSSAPAPSGGRLKTTSGRTARFRAVRPRAGSQTLTTGPSSHRMRSSTSTNVPSSFSVDSSAGATELLFSSATFMALRIEAG